MFVGDLDFLAVTFLDIDAVTLTDVIFVRLAILRVVFVEGSANVVYPMLPEFTVSTGRSLDRGRLFLARTTTKSCFLQIVFSKSHQLTAATLTYQRPSKTATKLTT